MFCGSRPNLAHKAAPLNYKLNKHQQTPSGASSAYKLIATHEQQCKLVSSQILALPYFASLYTLGAEAQKVLVDCDVLHEQPFGTTKQVGYWSLPLNKAEQVYDTTQLECLALVRSVLMLRLNL